MTISTANSTTGTRGKNFRELAEFVSPSNRMDDPGTPFRLVPYILFMYYCQELTLQETFRGQNRNVHLKQNRSSGKDNFLPELLNVSRGVARVYHQTGVTHNGFIIIDGVIGNNQHAIVGS